MKPQAEEFKQTVQEHRDWVYRLSFYLLGRSEDAEDATQETLIRLWKNWDNLAEETRRGWISTVARNLCMDVLRKRKKENENTVVLERAEDFLADSGPTADRVLSERDEHRFLMDAIRALEEPVRSVVLMREIEEMAYSEIAETLSIPLNSVKVYLFRGRRSLRETLNRRWNHEQVLS